MSRAGEIVEVLAVCPAEEDLISLRHIFSHSNWQFEGVRTRREALDRIAGHPSHVIICSESLPDGTWKDVLAGVSDVRCRPRIIVAAQPASDESVWADVLDLGAYDLLVKPFDPSEVVRVVSLAWRQWRHDCDPASSVGS